MSISPVSEDDGGIQQWLFDVLVRPTCFSGGPRIFLFVIGSALPIAFIAFGKWETEGAFLLAVGLLLSVVGFELATNAMRQAVSLAFLLAAVSLRCKATRYVALCIAVLLHISSWIFVPWFFLLGWKEMKWGKSQTYASMVAIPLVFLSWYFFGSAIWMQITSGTGLLAIYKDIYSADVTRAFLVFMLFPIGWVFAVRWTGVKSNMPRNEQLTFFYSAAVLAITIIFFPMITYRVAMTAAVLQMFVAMRAVDLSVKSGTWIWGGLAAHLLVYAAFSPNVRALLHG